MDVTMDESADMGYTTELSLKKSMMVSWDGWTTEAREYLKSVEDEVPLREEIEVYQREISSFYDWFFKYTRLYFKEEFESTRKLVEEIEEYKEGKMVYPKEFVLPFTSEDFKI